MFMPSFLMLCLFGAQGNGECAGTGVISDALIIEMYAGNPHDKKLVWVYFKDKTDQYNDNLLSERALDRIRKRSPQADALSHLDLPVSSDYIREVALTGARIRNRSRWFNAVSCYADANQIALISRFSFVSHIGLVTRYRHAEPQSADNLSLLPLSESDDPLGINYGPSLNQSNIINVPPAHDRGFTGQNVLIASFDSGFDNLEHNCFNKIRLKGLRTFDFVNGDTIVANGSGRMGNGAHGTLTLSLIAAYDPGYLVSPAFDALYLLA